MGDARRLGRIVLIALTLSVTGCRWPWETNRVVSVTVQLPPARPAVPEPSFSFGGTPRTVTEPAVKG
jgi:hypothetical protein